MTPKEEQWLAGYHCREARGKIKGLSRTLMFWGVCTIVWLIILFSEPEHKFNFSDSAFLMIIFFNWTNTIREIIRNKRIALGEKPSGSAEQDGSKTQNQ